jgi:hypothetical protein
MHRALDKLVDKLSKSLVQVSGLFAVSTTDYFGRFFGLGLYALKRTVYTQPDSTSAQPVLGGINLLTASFYPLSTRPINTTNLIKDLSL